MNSEHSGKIVLATESPYKKELFARLNLAFESQTPDLNETPKENEQASDLAIRLAREKAQKLGELSRYKNHWIIGADQCAHQDGNLVFKPGNHERAIADLSAYSGKSVDFYTAVTLLSPDRKDYALLDRTTVRFRELSLHEIENYLRIEQPYDCAGAFKAEGLGITLFESIQSEDPTALIGLPLIKLAALLRDQGFDCYANS